MFFRSYILRKSKVLLLAASLFMVFNSISILQNEQQNSNSHAVPEISVSNILLSLPVEINHFKTEKPHTISFERIDKAEAINCSLIKNKLKEVLFNEDQYDGLVRLQFFLINQFSTST